MQYLDRYTPEQARGHEVKPGLTPVKQERRGFTGQAPVKCATL